MKSKQYIFEQLSSEENSFYIFQLVTNRRLTDVYHSHDFYEVIMVLDGECEHMVNQTVFLQPANEVVFLRPGEKHKFVNQIASTKVLTLSVKKEEMQNLARAIDLELIERLNSEVICRLSLSESQGNELLTKALNSVTSDNMILDYKAMMFLYLIYFWDDRKKSRRGISNKLKLAFKEMNKAENLRRGVPALLEMTGYSYSHLSRLMRTHMHMTPHAYVVDLKLNVAYRRIIYTDELMEGISDYVGFESYSHFIKIFKKKYGITPAALRRSSGFYMV